MKRIATSWAQLCVLLCFALGASGCIQFMFIPVPDDAELDASTPDGGVPEDGGMVDGGHDAGDAGPNYVPGWTEPGGATQRSRATWVDFDGDGDEDLVLLGGSIASPMTRLFRSEGGDFVLDTSYPDGALRYTRAIAVGDMDGDGDLDLVKAIEEFGGEAFVISNRGTPDFFDDDAPLRLRDDCDGAVGASPINSLSVGDFDADGDLDIAIAQGADTYVMRNDAGAFECGWDLGAGAQAVQFLRLDAGRTGLAVGRDTGASIYVVDGVSDVRVVWRAPGAPRVRALAAGDVNGDSFMDLALGTEGADLVFVNDVGSFPQTAFWTSPDSSVTRAIELRDADGDGHADLARSDEDGNVSVARAGGAGFEPLYAELAGGPARVALGRPEPTRGLALAVAVDDGVSGGLRVLDASAALLAECPDRDRDGHRDSACGGDDCDDANDAVFPGAPSVCGNGVVDGCGADALSALRVALFGADVGEASFLAPATIANAGEEGVSALSSPVAVAIGPSGATYVGYVVTRSGDEVAEIAMGTLQSPGRRMRTLRARDGDLAGATARSMRDIALRPAGTSAPDEVLVSLVGRASDDGTVFGYACSHDERLDTRACTRLVGDPSVVISAALGGGAAGFAIRRYFLNSTGELGSTDASGLLGSYTSALLPAGAGTWIDASSGGVAAVAIGGDGVALHRGGSTSFDRLMPPGMAGGGVALAHLSAESYALGYSADGASRVRMVSCPGPCALGAAPSSEPPAIPLSERAVMNMERIGSALVVLAAARRSESGDALVIRLMSAALEPIGEAIELPLLDGVPRGRLDAVRVTGLDRGSGATREVSVLVAVTDGADSLERAVRVSGLRVCRTP